MKHELYQKIMEEIRKITPAPKSPEFITEGILNKIDNLSSQKKPFFLLRTTERQWRLINGIRTVVTIAASFLIVFFLLQQWQINSKLARLEKEVISAHHYPVEYNTGNTDRINAMYREINISPLSLKEDSLNKDMLHINRKSLNYILQEMERLRKENNSYHERLQKFLNDSSFSK